VGVGRTLFLVAVVGVRRRGCIRLAVGSGVGVAVAVGTDVEVGKRVYLWAGVAELQARMMSERALIMPNMAQAT
jgi:ABC-type glucose/galactose transport system permease subunit